MSIQMPRWVLEKDFKEKRAGQLIVTIPEERTIREIILYLRLKMKKITAVVLLPITTNNLKG